MSILIPKFKLHQEPTAALRLGWGFFLLLGGMFLAGAWMELNPRPVETPAETRRRVREEMRQELRERGIPASFPDLPPLDEVQPPAPAVRHAMAFQYMTLSLGMLFLLWLPIHKELRRRARDAKTEIKGS